MAQDKDFAVIVGVQTYPALDDPTSDDYRPLLGPVNDANAFYDWLTSPEGGDVPDANVAKIAKVYPPPVPTDGVAPRDSDLQDAFDKIAGRRGSRRLYIFMAGHGIDVPPPPGQPALLMANAGPRRFNNHFLGRAYADWFYRAGLFDEILLFMDCCRDNFPGALPNPVKFDPMNAADAVDRVRWVYAFGTKWSRRSRERAFDGVVRGVFSASLLAGLKGGAADATGRVTAGALRQFLYDHLKDFLDPEDVKGARVPQQPDFATWTSDARSIDDFVIVPEGKVEPLVYDVNLHLPEGAVGKTLVVQNGRFQPQAQLTVGSLVQPLKLPLGTYQALVLQDGLMKTFDVVGKVGLSAGGRVSSVGVIDV